MECFVLDIARPYGIHHFWDCFRSIPSKTYPGLKTHNVISRKNIHYWLVFELQMQGMLPWIFLLLNNVLFGLFHWSILSSLLLLLFCRHGFSSRNIQTWRTKPCRELSRLDKCLEVVFLPDSPAKTKCRNIGAKKPWKSHPMLLTGVKPSGHERLKATEEIGFTDLLQGFSLFSSDLRFFPPSFADSKLIRG